jgi:ABC-type maltose transport system permease subunit
MSLGEMFVSGLSAVWGGGSMFLMVIVAIVLGTIFGALPGVSATMAVALGLTFTYTMGPVPAIVFLTAIYCSSITGGSITAILFKIPGVPSSAPITFDGYPMAQRGEAGKALGIALLASAIGGLFSAIVMFLLSAPLSKAALASIGLMFAVAYWNDYTNFKLYITDRNLYNFQMKLRDMIASSDLPEVAGGATENTIRNACIITAILPFMILYPFLQKYFVKGIMLGAVKG